MGKWISAIHQKPKNGEHVLCTVEHFCSYPDEGLFEIKETFMCEGHYVKNKDARLRGWYLSIRPDMSIKSGDVIAWRPLPKPYKKEECSWMDS